MISTFLKPAIHVNGKKYKVIKQIGEGGFAYVYLVKSTSNSDNRDNYALKKMICQLPEQVEEAKKEIDAMVKIKHENVMPLTAFSYNLNKKGQEEVLLLMPLFKTSVQSIIDKSGGFPHCGFKTGDEVLHVLRESAKGLLAVHEAGFRHADFKPANILLGEKNQVAVTDFGSISPILQLIENRSDALQIQDTASRCTTASYRAPELFEPPTSCVIDGKSDVWSFGCTMYCMLYSKTPFESGTEGLSTLAVISGLYTIPPENIWPDDYLHIIRQCLQIELTKRYTIEELLQALNTLSSPPNDLSIKQQQSVKITLPSSPPPPVASSVNVGNTSTVSFATFDVISSDHTRTTRNSDHQLLALHQSSIDEVALFGEGSDAILVDFPSTPTTTNSQPIAHTAHSGNTAQSSTEMLHSEEDATSIVFVHSSDLSPLTISQKGSVNFEIDENEDEDEEERDDDDFIPDDFQSAPPPVAATVEAGIGVGAMTSTLATTEEATINTTTAAMPSHSDLIETLDQKASVEDPFGVDDEDDADTFGEFTVSTTSVTVTATGGVVASSSSMKKLSTKQTAAPSLPIVPPIEELPVYDVYNMIMKDVLLGKEHILKEGTVYTMRLGGFPKKLIRKPVYMLITKHGIVLKKESHKDAKVHAMLSFHRPLSLLASDTLSIGMNGVALCGSSPLSLPSSSSSATSSTPHQDSSSSGIGGIGGSDGNSVDSEWSKIDIIDGKVEDGGSSSRRLCKSPFHTMTIEIGFENKDTMNAWMDIIWAQWESVYLSSSSSS